MKKLGIIITVLVLFSFIPGLIGCGSAPTTPTTPTTPTVSPTSPTTPTTPTAAFKPIKLKYAFKRQPGPEALGQPTYYVMWIPAVEAASNGRIKIDSYPADSLITEAVAYQAVPAGVADIANANPWLGLGFMPLMEFWYLPTLPAVDKAMINPIILWFKMYDRYFQKEYESPGIVSLGFMSIGPGIVFTLKKPLTKMEDFKGVTLRISSVTEGDLLTKLGGLPISMGIADVYESLQKGVVEGGVWNWEGPFSRKWTELGKPGYFNDVGTFPQTSGSFIINKAVYNGLPKDLQELIVFMNWRWADLQQMANVDASVSLYQKMAKDAGIGVNIWSDEQKAKLNTEIGMPMWDQWVVNMEKKYKRGAEAAEIIKVYKEELAKYIPPKPVPLPPQLGGDAAAWDRVWGKPDSTWDRDYKAYPNLIGLRQLEGNEFKSWK
ncbi:MAG: TRAP transporter substrate-binding protein DctP [Chloroflexota bacterium]